MFYKSVVLHAKHPKLATLVSRCICDRSIQPMPHSILRQGHGPCYTAQKKYMNSWDAYQKFYKRKDALHTSIDQDSIFTESNRKLVIDKLDHMKQRPLSLKSWTIKRQSAVLVPLCHVNGEPSILFMMRSRHLKSHAGEVCFPGGIQDESDTDLTNTALRETREEIGLPDGKVDVWGQMPPVPSRYGTVVTPVIGYCNDLDLDQLVLNHDEVETVFTNTITSLCDESHIRQTQFRRPGSYGYSSPVYNVGEFRIWGLTSLMLHQVLMVLAPGLYRYKLRYNT